MQIHRNKLKDWLFKHKKPVIIVSSAVLVLAAGLTTTLIIISKNSAEEPIAEEKPPEPEPEKPAPKYYSNLTGREIADESSIDAATTCIMIENSPDARPQSGLRDAGVVFEAIAEGGITRFLAIFQDRKPDYVGPVRSVRPYYVEWLRPFSCSIAHVGGSAEALAMIKNNPAAYRDIDQFYNGSYYWRTSDRHAPHNVYTSFEKLDALNVSRGYTSSEFTAFPRIKTIDKDEELNQEDSDEEAPSSASQISLKISYSTFNVTYNYSSATNSYLRSHGDKKPHLDKASNGIESQNSPDTVIAIMVEERPSTTEKGREEIVTSGSGTAYVFQDGAVVEGTWQKLSPESQITFHDESGKTVPLNPGQTWITAVPRFSGAVTWQ